MDGLCIVTNFVTLSMLLNRLLTKHIFSCIFNLIFRTECEEKFFCGFLLKHHTQKKISMCVFYIAFYLYFFSFWWAFDIACECVCNVAEFRMWKGEQKKAIEISSHSFSFCLCLLSKNLCMFWVDWLCVWWWVTYSSIANVCTNVFVRHYCICVTLFSLYYEIYWIFSLMEK